MTTEQRKAAILRHMGWAYRPEIEDAKWGLLVNNEGTGPVHQVTNSWVRWPSLDALALVEDGLTDEQWNSYLQVLERTAKNNPSAEQLHRWQKINASRVIDYFLVTATFSQRLHALCLTLGLEEPS